MINIFNCNTVVTDFDKLNGFPGFKFTNWEGPESEDSVVEEIDNSRLAVFKRVSEVPIKLENKIINKDTEVVGQYGIISGLPGMVFVEWHEEPSEDIDEYDIEEIEEVVEEVDNNEEIVESADTSYDKPDENVELLERITDAMDETKDVEHSNISKINNVVDEVSCTFGINNKTELTPERIEELKSIEKREWITKTKSEFQDVLDEIGVDYSHLKDDRMVLYKFLLEEVLKEL